MLRDRDGIESSRDDLMLNQLIAIFICFHFSF
jgi:hypothetical protein